MAKQKNHKMQMQKTRTLRKNQNVTAHKGHSQTTPDPKQTNTDTQIYKNIKKNGDLRKSIIKI